MKSAAAPSLGQVLRVALEGGRLKLPRRQRKILNVLAACGTGRLGGHRYRCERCGGEHFVAHRCGNRHCPNCQGGQAVEWLSRQEAVLLPITYFHVVFTVPHRLNALIRQNRRVMFNLLFESASRTLLEFGRNQLKAQIGITGVLHTWGQTLAEHYHLHCIVTGGGLALDGAGWVRASEHYLFAVRALSKVFSGKFRAGLRELYAHGKLEFHGKVKVLTEAGVFEKLLGKLKEQKWVVYAKRPFAGPRQVLEYLSRYTHRVAISNRRLLSLEDGRVNFSYKDYSEGQRRKTMRLAVEEFVRRFCLHVLPERFVKIRHYGLVGNRNRTERIARARQSLGLEERPVESEEGAQKEAAPGPSKSDVRLRCPRCGMLSLVWVEEVPRNARRIGAIWDCDTS